LLPAEAAHNRRSGTGRGDPAAASHSATQTSNHGQGHRVGSQSIYERRNNPVIFDEIWRMQRSERKLARAYYKRIEKLRKDKRDEEQIALMMSEDVTTLSQLEMDIVFAESQKLTQEARRLKVPLPERNDEAWNAFFDHNVLTPKGYADLRSNIRQEQRERRETVTALIKDIISPVGGIIISILSLLIAYAALKLKQ
jgi:hypothetical protein